MRVIRAPLQGGPAPLGVVAGGALLLAVALAGMDAALVHAEDAAEPVPVNLRAAGRIDGRLVVDADGAVDRVVEQVRCRPICC